MDRPFPILEFDPAPEGVLEPSRLIAPVDIAKHAVLCFFPEVIAAMVERYHPRLVCTLTSELGGHPVYEMEFHGRRLAFLHAGMGAPVSAGFLLEEVIALGCRKFVACGGAGVLDPTIAMGHLLLPTVAVRDEGTSYHYLPAAREVQADPVALAAIEATLAAHHVAYLPIKTWTTDALYRETPAKVRQRRAEGCQAVEMEAAAFFAVAQFRRVTFGQILYGGDNVGAEEWDSRDWTKNTTVREKLFLLAAEACLRIDDYSIDD
ncbi:MAG: nucleoside phosphorylase [Chloroflexaceae bacterium]|nr:nucleoside phosphorylase [Chloroflexaceae bacterium]